MGLCSSLTAAFDSVDGSHHRHRDAPTRGAHTGLRKTRVGYESPNAVLPVNGEFRAETRHFSRLR